MDNFVKRYRECQGDDQLDLFPEQPQTNWFWKHLPTFVVIIMTILLVTVAYAFPVSAQEGIRGDGHDEFHHIYKNLHNSMGVHCCDNGDCRKTTAKKVNGEWYAKVEGVWTHMKESRRTLEYPYSWSDTAHVCASPDNYVFCFIPEGYGF